MTKQTYKSSSRWSPFGLPFGTLGAPLGPLVLNWSSVWLPFAPAASSNVDFVANPKKWTQNNSKIDPTWSQSNSKMDLKMKPKLTQTIECKTN